MVERGPSPGFRCGVERKCVLRAVAVSLTALFLEPQTFSVKAWVVTFTVRALVGEVVCAGVCFVRVGTSATGGSIRAAVATFVAETLTTHAADGFHLRFFGDYASVEYGCTFFQNLVCRGGVPEEHSHCGNFLVRFPVFNWFDPFSFEEGGRFKAIEDLKLTQVVVIFGIKLDGDKLGDDLVCPVLYVST